MRVILPWLQGICLAAALATAASAQGLQRADMSKIPLSDINLQGGNFIVRLLEAPVPFKSQLLMECQDCARPTDALVGLVVDSSNEGDEFAHDPDAYFLELDAVCQSRSAVCKLTQSTVGGMDGYALTARYNNGFLIVEHTYFSNGLMFVINASGPSLDLSDANVATLIKVAGPYVTGQKQ